MLCRQFDVRPQLPHNDPVVGVAVGAATVAAADNDRVVRVDDRVETPFRLLPAFVKDEEELDELDELEELELG